MHREFVDANCRRAINEATKSFFRFCVKNKAVAKVDTAKRASAILVNNNADQNVVFADVGCAQIKINNFLFNLKGSNSVLVAAFIVCFQRRVK